MQITNLHVRLYDRLAGELEYDADGSVHRRMRRPHVQMHGLRRQLQLAVVELDIERFHP